jgi:uncharacterized repeat protein (TIGR02543 family)
MKKSFYDRLVDIVIALKWVYIILLISALGYIAWFIFFYSSCVPKNEMICYNDDYFIYRVEENNKIYIIGLTDKGKEQQYLIIPEKINRMDVVKIGCTNRPQITAIAEKYGDEKYAQIGSENLRKIFFMSDVAVIHNAWMVGDGIQYCPNLEGLFYISKKEYISANEYYELPFVKNPANLSYFYNYDNAPNDNYYWIDNYAYGGKIEFIPPVPTRAGYTFGGWYKESECINKWNFEVDTLPNAIYGEDNFELYQETRLYAKWIEIGG